MLSYFFWKSFIDTLAFWAPTANATIGWGGDGRESMCVYTLRVITFNLQVQIEQGLHMPWEEWTLICNQPPHLKLPSFGLRGFTAADLSSLPTGSSLSISPALLWQQTSWPNDRSFACWKLEIHSNLSLWSIQRTATQLPKVLNY